MASLRSSSGLLRLAAALPRSHTLRRGFLSNSRSVSSQASQRSQQKDHSSRNRKKPSLVIFDKNGTLTCFHSKWTPWVQATASRLEISTGLNISQEVFKTLGFCRLTQKTRTGLLAEATTNQVKKRLEELLVTSGLDQREALWILEHNWQECDASEFGSLQQLSDLPALFSMLKDQDIKIAICTSDSRAVTESAFKQLGIIEEIDAMVCGDDRDCLPKPSSHNAHMICETLNVHPKEAVMVGDTRTDIDMSKSAGLGMSIGVLSGIGSRLDLHQADHIVTNVQDILPLILPKKQDGDVYRYSSNGKEFVIPASHITTLPEMQEVEHVSAAKQQAKLVIFDKDGTLICFHSMWTPWAVGIAERTKEVTGIDLTKEICDLLGFSEITLKCRPGLLAESTMPIIRQKLQEVIEEAGLSRDEAAAAVETLWEECDTSSKETLKSLDDLHKLFSNLKKHGIKIAVCTADSRIGTEGALEVLGLNEYVDIVVCGDDHGTKPKPHPLNALNICRKLNVHPSEAVMVGDTEADMGMGRAAKLGATIGVLSGVGSTKHLAAQADHVVPSVKHILPIVVGQEKNHGALPKSSPSSSKAGKRSYHTSTHSYNPFNTQKRNFSTSQGRQMHIASDNPKYTHIIVGAGSAGCVLSNRLSSDPENKVMLLEAGRKDDTWKIHMPAALMFNLCDDQYNWFYHTVPQKHMNNRVMYCPRGRVWGGSSALNAMVYIRGHAHDYNKWEKLGATGWSYADCLPYFRKSQTHELGADDYRGGEGPLHVSRGITGNPLHKVFIEAGQEAGYPYTDDMNGYQQEGVGWMDMNIHRGMRWSAAKAYLRPILYRSNIETENGVLASRIIFDGTKAIGVEYEQHGQVKRMYAEKEVILCGGAINSPQLLMLSGIGNADDLKKLDIPVVAHRPGVGENLQDHLEVYVQQACAKPVTLYSAQWKFPHNMVAIGFEWFKERTGWGATAHLESGGFIRSQPGVDHPDIQFHFLPSVVVDHGRKTGHCHAYQLHVGPMRSESRGYLKLKTADPKDHPIIDFNYMSTEQDRKEMRDAVRLSREIFAQPAFDAYRKEELAPGIDVQSDEQIDAFIREMADSAYHPSCTAKMGLESDPMAVVDPSCRVIGVDGLRVVDASIMPHVVSGNLNGPTIMVAEKAADIILGRAPLPKSTAPVFQPPSDDIKLFSHLQKEVISSEPRDIVSHHTKDSIPMRAAAL